jgi:hypothetical protein
MTTAGGLDRGRESFARQAWATAYAELAAADRDAPLGPEDLQRLAVTAHLVGRDDESAELWERLHRELLRDGQVERAARSAFWLAFGLLNRGEAALGGGWIARAGRLLDEAGCGDCVERGYLLVPEALRRMAAGEVEADPFAISTAAAEATAAAIRDAVSQATGAPGVPAARERERTTAQRSPARPR